MSTISPISVSPSAGALTTRGARTRSQHRSLVARTAAAGTLVLLGSSCGAHAPCTTSAPTDRRCADLQFENHFYDAWRTTQPTWPLQELGDATYPTCTRARGCNGDDLHGHGATDVWRIDGVDPAQAVLGIREHTHTYTVFVRIGVDPHTLALPSRSP